MITLRRPNQYNEVGVGVSLGGQIIPVEQIDAGVVTAWRQLARDDERTRRRPGYVLNHVDVSGIEYVTGAPSGPFVISGELPPGSYHARVYLLDWDDLPTKTDSHPDFVVLVGPSKSDHVRGSL